MPIYFEWHLILMTGFLLAIIFRQERCVKKNFLKDHRVSSDVKMYLLESASFRKVLHGHAVNFKICKNFDVFI